MDGWGACVSVDLDAPKHYCQIHGLDPALMAPALAGVVGRVALPRLLECFASAGVPATLFVIGSELDSEGLSAGLRRALNAGVALENHTWSHDYALSRRPLQRVLDDIRRGHDALVALGAQPTGFRAPGYLLSATVLEALETVGYSWDSSAFPATPYYLAKLGVMAALRLTGRPSRACVDSPRVLGAPTVPYFPDRQRPYARGDSPVLELPIAVAPGLRLPLIGTTLSLLPEGIFRALVKTTRHQPLFNLELHALDAIDASDGFPDALVARQPDLRVSAQEKLARLKRLLLALREVREVLTLADAAARIRKHGEVA